MYTNTRVDGHPIKLILDTASARIITANGATKTPIGEIDDFPIEINGIIVPIKVLVMNATQYQVLVGNDWLSKTNAVLDWMTQELILSQNGRHTRVLATCDHFKATSTMAPLIDFNKKKPKPTWEAYQVLWADKEHNELPPILFWDNNNKGKKKQKEELIWETNDLTWTDNDESELTSSWEWEEDKENKGKGKEEETTQTIITYNNTYTIPQQSTYLQPKLICVNYGKKLSSMGTCCGKWDNQPCLTCGETLLDEGMWNDIPGRKGTCNILCQYTILISDWVRKGTPMEAACCPHDDDKFWQMALVKIKGATPEKIKTIKNNPPEPLELDWDAEPIINLLDLEQFHEHYQELAPTREEQEQRLEQLNCDLIYNPPPRMIYMIPEEEEPISSCTSESESPINQDSNPDNNDDNNGSSSVQNGNDNDNDSNSDINSDLNYKQYIALPDLSKEQELKWYSDNEEGIMPEHVHNTNAGFDLRYPEKDAIKLELHSRICIDLKIALEIPATTMVQLASRSSLAKKGINIKGGIINAGYAYVIEPNEKIAQAIFLPLVRIAQLVSVRKREKLRIMAREIQGFGSTGRIDVPVNMAEEEIVGQREIISTGQAISIPLYSQYMLAIKRKEKEQEQIFEAKATLCELEEIGLINLHIAKSYSSIKIPIYNNNGNVINIPEGTTIRYLTTEIEDQPPNPIPDFLQLCGYVDITSQTIYG
ncbi:hypothetical protein G9A89_023848 [Geosiphon pyriformis]|nr:hypothetical protein G9A89_023848 [Geosiphon pyriformis]